MNYIVTGATGAIGSAAVKMLCQQGHHVIGTSRRAELEDLHSLDVSSADSIEAFVQRLESDGIRIDGLLNNAGAMHREYGVTSEGFERVLATNYLGTYRLTRRLLPLMNPGARVVNTVSLSCYVAKLNKDFFNQDPQKYRQIQAYADSKMAVMLFAEELQKRHGNQIQVRLTDPGIVNSRMIHMDRWFDPIADAIFRPLCKTPEAGATPAVNALNHTAAESDIQLFRGQKHSNIPSHWIKPQMATWLWDETEKILDL